MSLSALRIRKAAVSKAETQLKLLETQLENYRSDNGGFPYPEPDGIDREGLILYKALFGDGVGPDHLAGTEDDTKTDGQPDEGARIYIAELDPGSNSLGMVESIGGRPPTRVLDPFGFTWRYRSGEHEKAMNPDFDLWSPGPDGADDTADDIKNW